MQVDHKIPVSRGGSDDPENLVAACKPCNHRKSTATREEFLAGKLPFSKLPKALISAMVPADLATLIRLKAARERRSVSEVSSELMLRGAGLDPADYGIAAVVTA